MTWAAAALAALDDRGPTVTRRSRTVEARLADAERSLRCPTCAGAAPARPVAAWSHLAAPVARAALGAHLDRRVRRDPPAGTGGCWFCGRARSARWLLDRGGRWSCGGPLCHATGSNVLRTRVAALRALWSAGVTGIRSAVRRAAAWR